MSQQQKESTRSSPTVSKFTLVSLTLSFVCTVAIGVILTDRYSWSTDKFSAAFLHIIFWVWLNLWLLGATAGVLSEGRFGWILDEEEEAEALDPSDRDQATPQQAAANDKRGCLMTIGIAAIGLNALGIFLAWIFLELPNVWELGLVVISSAFSALCFLVGLQAFYDKHRSSSPEEEP